MKPRASILGTLVLHLLVVLSFLNATAPVAWPCKGTPQNPTCSRSIWIAKSSPGNVLVTPRANGTNAAFHVPIGVLPFVQWTQGGTCAQPVSAELKITLTITPVDGGGPVTFMQTFQLKTPVVRGQQPLPGSINFPIAEGSLPAGSIPAECAVQGTLNVVFGPANATGAGTLSATGDMVVCLVPPAPNMPAVPRLDIRYLPLDKKGTELFQTQRRGDQTIFYFVINNNDSANSVMLDLASEGKQVAHLPDGFAPNDPKSAYDVMVHAISDPRPGTDTFGAAFTDELMPGELIAELDPDTPDPLRIERKGVIIPPLGSTIVPISMRSHGMCADGSCSERFLKVTGNFSDNTPALGCASTALVVGNVGSKSPLLEITDTIKCGPKVSASWTPTALFDDKQNPIEHAFTHGTGNLPITQLTDARRTETAGARVPLTRTNNMRFPPTDPDTLRLAQEFHSLDFQVDASVPNPAQPGTVELLSDGFHAFFGGALNGAPSRKVQLPLIFPNPMRPMFFDIFYDMATDALQLTEPNPPIGTNPITYNGTLANLIKRPPPNLRVDLNTCRTFTLRNQLGLPVIATDPIGVSQLATKLGEGAEFEVTTTPELLGATWRAALFPPAAGSLSCGSHGLLPTPIHVGFKPAKASQADTENISVLNVVVAGAVNSPAKVPVDLRPVYDICLQDDSNGDAIAFNSITGDFVLCHEGHALKVFGKPARSRGTITRVGDKIQLADVLIGGSGLAIFVDTVSAEFDTTNRTGTASAKALDNYGGPPKEFFSVHDNNTADSKCCR